MTGPPGSAESLRGERGQTGFDFLVGMSVFLITVGIVFTFAPGMFEPFDADTGSTMVIADRSASMLSEDLLVEDVTRPSVLNATCTADFFDTDPDNPNCRFDQNGTDLDAALQLDEFRGLNVTIESSGSILTVEGDRLAAGPAPPATADVVVGKRTVLIGETQGVLQVRVW
jgi:hypothetical protein